MLGVSDQIIKGGLTGLGVVMQQSFRTDPLMCQIASDSPLGARMPVWT